MCILSFALIFSVFVATAITQNTSARNFHSDCGQVFTQKQFIIESPNFPSNYPLNYECSYLLKGATCPTRFTLHFVDFSVEDSLGCTKDRLEIEDRDALCGNRNGEVREYFSDKGTLILKFVSDKENSGRGYRILVTRSQCEQEKSVPEITTQNIPKWYTTNNDVEYTTSTKQPLEHKNKRQCCQTSYTSKQFTLTSPNFPYSMSTATECVYEIYKTNINVCRLRIHVHFFWLGQYTNDCSEGFLEIDGKRLCGCKSDLKIISPFEGQSVKLLRFVSGGYERASYSGFVVDVIQDECPKKIIPEDHEKNVTLAKKFRFYNDQINRVAWPSKSHNTVIEKLHLISENTEIIPERAKLQEGSQPEIIRHVYFYSYPDFNRTPRDREETEYVDTSSSGASFENDNTDYSYCRNWNQMQFNSLSLRNLPICKTNEGNAIERKCLDLNQPKGYFQSPGYPYYYPGNLNICYRFYKSPGYCTIQIHMKDFNLQRSASCENDYLLSANQLKYCGGDLTNTISDLDLRNKPFEQMNFVTDAFYCGRGFFGTYEQIPCQDFSHPINPTPPPPVAPMKPCSRTVGGEIFTFDVYGYNERSCSLVIRKYTKYVCSVRLYFEKFDLTCGSESLVVDGTMYCGHMTGQSVKIDVMEQDPVIIYKRSSDTVTGLRLRIRGVQVSDDCSYPQVPAERFLIPTNYTDSKNDTQFLLKISQKFKSICGIITNTTESKLPETFCDIIMKNDNNVRSCLPLNENILIVPLESQNIELKIRNATKTEQIEFKEVDCDKLTK